jgi:hypothetical protein
MGNSNQPISQNNATICMQCHDKNILNTSFMILSCTNYTNTNRCELLLRCSNGHLFTYRNITTHIDYLYEKITKNNVEQNKIDELNKEIIYLKKEIESLNQIINGIPPLVTAEIMK